MDIKLEPIGIIRSPYTNKNNSPRQGRYSNETSVLTVYKKYMDGIEGIDLHSHYMIFYWQDHAVRNQLKVVPHGKTEKRGVFSTRAPVRPNPIGFCLVEVVNIEDNQITVQWLDAWDGSPLLDIKPYWQEIDTPD
jgi:tRNA-Thr(GGU) m(6)t(6)A37 methyltransferase TsaA